MLRKALLIFSGNALASILTLARNLIVARLIPVEDYGVAATFAVTMAIVEMASSLGLQQQIVQAKDGDDPRFQAALQGFQLLRGGIAALILLALAYPLANFLGIPEVTWAYQILAVMPVLNALVHFDIWRLNRSMVFLPGVLTVTIPAFVSLMVVWPLATLYGDWRIMLWAIISQGVVTAGVSHLIAQRSYRLVLDPTIMVRNFTFGWPLLANAVLLFFVMHGDKLIVGREMGMVTLGIFAMGVTLMLTPTLVAAKSALSFFLPQITKNQPIEVTEKIRTATIQSTIMMTMLFIMLVSIFGGPLVYILLGSKYAILMSYLNWIAIIQSVRMLKSGPAIVALANGNTANALAANMIRVASLPIAWYVASETGELLLVLWIAIMAEALGYVVALALLNYRIPGVMRGLMIPHLGVICSILLAGGYTHAIPTSTTFYLSSLWLGLAFTVILFATFLSMDELRGYIATHALSKNRK